MNFKAAAVLLLLAGACAAPQAGGVHDRPGPSPKLAAFVPQPPNGWSAFSITIGNAEYAAGFPYAARGYMKDSLTQNLTIAAGVKNRAHGQIEAVIADPALAQANGFTLGQLKGRAYVVRPLRRATRPTDMVELNMNLGADITVTLRSPDEATALDLLRSMDLEGLARLSP